MIEILNNISLKHLNTFGIDAKACFFVKISYVDELFELIQTDVFQSNKRFILGGGSNVLFKEDFNGLIIFIDIKGVKFEQTTSEGMIIKAGAGENWSEFVELCTKNRLYGIENLVYIPGKVGAAPVQNIGAYGVEQKDYFHSLEALNLETGKIDVFCRDDCEFEYRSSIFKTKLADKYIILYVYYELSRIWQPNLNYKELKQELDKFSFIEQDAEYVLNTVKRIRKRKLPDPKELGNAGSFFKNPIIDKNHFYELKEKFNDIPFYNSGDKYKISAAYLIEKCGWKGVRYGNCGVSEKHSLILVNYGNASGEEILKLSEEIRLSVFEKFKINLEREVIVVE